MMLRAFDFSSLGASFALSSTFRRFLVPTSGPTLSLRTSSVAIYLQKVQSSNSDMVKALLQHNFRSLSSLKIN